MFYSETSTWILLPVQHPVLCITLLTFHKESRVQSRKSTVHQLCYFRRSCNLITVLLRWSNAADVYSCTINNRHSTTSSPLMYLGPSIAHATVSFCVPRLKPLKSLPNLHILQTQARTSEYHRRIRSTSGSP